MAELYVHQLGEAQTVAAGRPLGPPLLPRPLVLVDGLGLTLSEDVCGPANGGAEPVSEAGKLLHPRAPMPRSADAVAVIAVGLARLHTYPLPPGWPARTASNEAARAVGRAKQLAAYAPDHADRAVALAERVAERLEATATPAARTAHGSFKSAQLLFRGNRLFITDFDQLCAADPALDVGYFLAYLRPPSLWYRRRDARDWYDQLERVFLDTYTRTLAELGCARLRAGQVAARSHLYSAALMFKIANRRPNRLNSVRAGELDAMLAEIGRCVDRGFAPPC
jgi:thiamine kinase-like enzyme